MHILLYELAQVHLFIFQFHLAHLPAVIVELRSTFSDLISIEQFVICVFFTVHDKLSGKNFLDIGLLNTQMIFYPRVSQRAFWESAVHKPFQGQTHRAL